MQEPPYDIISWDDAPLRPLASYTCYDIDGKEVQIQPKNPANHESGHPLQDEPAVFYNLRSVISEPDSYGLSTSQNPKAIENRQKGKIVVYSKSNLVNQLDMPGYEGIDAQVNVVVLYPHDGTTPFSLTYRLGPK